MKQEVINLKELVEYDFTDGHIESISAQKMNAEIRFMTWRDEPVKLLFEDCHAISSTCALGGNVECVVQSNEEACLVHYQDTHARFAPPLYLFTFISSSEGEPTLRVVARRLIITKSVQARAWAVPNSPLG